MTEENTNVTVKMTFPMKEWMEWDKSCKEEFGDVRWLKAWNDHKNANQDYKYQLLNNKVDSVLAMYAESMQKKEEQPKETKPKTLGGND